MRSDIENFAVDDGRGAVLNVTLALGQVTWEPPAQAGGDMPHLAVQIQAAAEKSLQRAQVDGGNRINVARLNPR